MLGNTGLIEEFCCRTNSKGGKVYIVLCLEEGEPLVGVYSQWSGSVRWIRPIPPDKVQILREWLAIHYPPKVLGRSKSTTIKKMAAGG